MLTERQRGSLHDALKLPRRYRVHTSVEGYIENTHHALRLLRTDTHGQTVAFALSVSWEPWQEIRGEDFLRLAKRILEP